MKKTAGPGSNEKLLTCLAERQKFYKFLCHQHRTILEEKAALYERLKSGVEVLEDDNLNQKFLINFQVMFKFFYCIILVYMHEYRNSLKLLV